MQKVSDCISQWKGCASLCLTQIVIFEFWFEIYLGKEKNNALLLIYLLIFILFYVYFKRFAYALKPVLTSE